MSNSTNTGIPKNKVAKGTVINSKTFNDHVHTIDASNITAGLSLPVVNYKSAVTFKQRAQVTIDEVKRTVTPVYKVNDNGYIFAHGMTNTDQDIFIFAATAAEAFTCNILPAQLDRFLLLGFGGGGYDHGAGCIPTVKGHAWVIAGYGNDPSRWIGEYCTMGSQVTSAAFQEYTSITPKYFYPAYGRIKNCIQPRNGYRLVFQRPWSNLLNNYSNKPILTTQQTPETTEPETPETTEPETPETTEPETPATVAEASEPATVAEVSEPATEKTDETDTGISAVLTGTISILKSTTDHFLKLNDPYTMYGYKPTYGAPFKCGLPLTIENSDKHKKGLFCSLSSASSLSAIALNGSCYDSYLYRGPNSTTGISYEKYVGYNGIEFSTYHNNIDTYVLKHYSSEQINKTGSYLLRYYYTPPSSAISPAVHNNNWGYVSCIGDNNSSKSIISYDNVKVVNGINKVTLQIVSTPITTTSSSDSSDANKTKFNIAARFIHQFQWDDISKNNTGGLYSNYNQRYYTNSTKMCMCIMCTPNYFIENILPNIPRNDKGILYPNSNPVKKLFIKVNYLWVYEITSIVQNGTTNDEYIVHYKKYKRNTTDYSIDYQNGTDSYTFKKTDTKTKYTLYEYEVDPSKLSSASESLKSYNTYKNQPNPHPVWHYFKNVVNFSNHTKGYPAPLTVQVTTGLSTRFYFWRFRHVCVAISPIVSMPSCNLIYNIKEFDSSKADAALIPPSQIPNLMKEILNQRNSSNKQPWTVYESLDINEYYTNDKTWFQVKEIEDKQFGFYIKKQDQTNYIEYEYKLDCYFEQHNLYSEQPAEGTISAGIQLDADDTNGV